MSVLILLTVAVAAAVAQVIKMILDAVYFHHKLTFSEIIMTGGMPSAHVATVTSLATIIYLLEEVSTSFVISLVLAIIVIRDAIGVRYTVGKEGEAINHIIQKLHLKLPKQAYALGHKPTEAFVGAVIGVLVAIGMHGWFV